jgi:hypothetical protein
LGDLAPPVRPDIVPAALGADAGAVGVAALATQQMTRKDSIRERQS